MKLHKGFVEHETIQENKYWNVSNKSYMNKHKRCSQTYRGQGKNMRLDPTFKGDTTVKARARQKCSGI